MDFSADGEHFVSAGLDKAARLWTLDEGKEIRAFVGRTNAVHSVAFDNTGRWLAVGTGMDARIRLWDLDSGRPTLHLSGRRGMIDDLVFSPDGRLLASASNDDTLKLWDVASGGELGTFRGHSDEVYEVAFSPDGQRLVSASRDNTLRLWDVASSTQIWARSGHETHVTAVAFSPTGKQIASGGYRDRTIKLWDAESGRELRAMTGHEGPVVAMAFSPDGHRLATGSWDRTVRLWDTKTGREILSISNSAGVVVALAFGPDGTEVTAGMADNRLRTWNSRNGSLLRTFSGHGGTVLDLADDKTGRRLASAGEDGSVRIWERASGKELALLTTTRGTEDWLVVTGEGLFDGSEEAMRQLVAWRIGRQVYSLDQFFEDFYVPDLLARLVDGERPIPRIDASRLRLPPEVKLLTPLAGKSVSDEKVSVTVEATDLGGGIQEVRLYHNGKAVETRPGSRGKLLQRFHFDLSLVGGENRLTALAISEDRVESNEDSLKIFYPPASDIRPRLYLLSVGINRYRDPSLDLQFARPDALSIAGYFKARGEQLFDSVSVTTLIDENATAASLRSTLDHLAGEARPEDVVIVYLAGHGVMIGQQFYFLTHGMTGSLDDQAALHEHGLPSYVFGQFLRRSSALKQILILDTCHSGSALTILGRLALARGPAAAEKKALKMLARASGVYLIAASTAQQFAYEIKELGHGVLTYALLSGLGERGEPRVPTGDDGLVTIHALLQYVNQVVPELTETYHNGNRQYPVSSHTGMDFPLAVR